MSEVALREYIERLIEERDKRYDERFRASDRAVEKAEKSMAARLDSMNEFREALKDQANRMATRTELAKIDENVQELRRAKANFDGRLIVISGIVSFVTALALWALSVFLT